MKIKNFTYLFLIAFVFFTACLDDIIPPALTGELDSTAKILMFFEQNGDFINSELAPPLITAQELSNNIGNYFIVDVRKHDQFVNGHIENAINIQNPELYDFVKSFRDSTLKNIVLISKNGQASSYYSTLLRLAGYDNIFSLKYGMASWNFDFADEWLNALDDKSPYFVDDEFQKNVFTDLPALSADSSNIPIEELVINRIRILISTGYTYNDAYVYDLSYSSDFYLVCYGNSSLYFAGKLFGYKGHPVGATYYNESPLYDFRSINYLQTLPTDKGIVIYDYDGQLSSSMTAYLKILGYSVRSLLFGANQLCHTRMAASVALHTYAFSASEIMNFEYVTGE